MDPLVSVLIPTFNRSVLLRRALGSVQAQAYRNIEILVSDNHSTDDTLAVVEEFARRDSRMRYMTTPPNNTSAMVNFRGLVQAATGKYAVILADDDFFLDYRYLQEGVRTLEECRLGLLIADCVLGRARRQITSMDIEPVTSGRNFFLKYWRHNYHIPSVSNLFDVALARKCDPWRDPSILYSDVELWLKLMTLTDVAYYGFPAVYYHYHGANIVSTITLDQHKQNIRFIESVSRFAAPVFGEPTVLEWKKGMLIEYWQLLLRERHQPTWTDFAEMRATLHLADEPLGVRRWSRVLEYLRRSWLRSSWRTITRKAPEPPCNDLLNPTTI
jgi:glycosyltransferase involved in cell wall biosynthesis